MQCRKNSASSKSDVRIRNAFYCSWSATVIVICGEKYEYIRLMLTDGERTRPQESCETGKLPRVDFACSASVYLTWWKLIAS